MLMTNEKATATCTVRKDDSAVQASTALLSFIVLESDLNRFIQGWPSL